MTNCERHERALFEEDAAALRDLASHAEACDACREKAALWKRVAETAPSLRKSWESPGLLARIEEAAKAPPAPARRPFWLPVGIAAGIAAYGFATWLSLQHTVPYQPDIGLLEGTRERLLSDETMKDVETKEAAFVASIDALERRAKTALESPPTPLAANLKERLVLIDSAIAECRREIEKNEFNTNLRRELLAMYQEKKKTLQEIVNDGDRKS